ncbi:hypothetical protein BAE44_0011657 [Dichanthelium oligosanthes]|uniref:CAAX prenyl protease 2/Lysostaphin resistance protein A-like domain-containing protein n=1 Tax=Dichanthelium oligosanthes TaxID=888268 RepID=A0A1E5VQF5_9POAL|nr:hypothetical protein BAE44_0011657 [Dichanthelium oligosanthes]
MASPPSLLLLRPRPPLCGRSRSRSLYLHLSKQSLHPLTAPPGTCRRPVAAPVAEQLVPLPPGTGRWTGATGVVACRCSYDAENGPPTPPPDMKSLDDWPVLRKWDVPWEWPTISLTMVACAVSFLLTGMIEQSILEQLGFQVGEATLDEKAECSSTTVVVLGSIFGITNTFRPFSDDIFRYKFEEPFKLQNGWLLWAGIGLLVAIIAIALAGAAMTFLNGETPQRETDSLVILLPLIGSSGIRYGLSGFFFLVLSFSTPYAVLITAAVFAFAHLTPGEFPQLFVLGVVLGFSYAQTRNLLTPVTIHAIWNSGEWQNEVALVELGTLSAKHLQGYDIKELLQAS